MGGFTPVVYDGGNTGNSTLAAKRVLKNALGVTTQLTVNGIGDIEVLLPNTGTTRFIAHLPVSARLTSHDTDIVDTKGIAILMDHGFHQGLDVEAVAAKANTIQNTLREKLGIPELYVELIGMHDVDAPLAVTQRCGSIMGVFCPLEDSAKLQGEGSRLVQELIEASTSTHLSAAN